MQYKIVKYLFQYFKIYNKSIVIISKLPSNNSEISIYYFNFKVNWIRKPKLLHQILNQTQKLLIVCNKNYKSVIWCGVNTQQSLHYFSLNKFKIFVLQVKIFCNNGYYSYCT